MRSSSRRLPFAIVALATLPALPAGAKRAPPADVPPVVDGSVRYEAPHFGNPCGQNGGCVVAHDNASNAVLWSVQVYCTHYDPSLETDVQDVFITALTGAGGNVQVANEKGQHFVIDPSTGQVSGDATGCGGGSSGGCSVAATAAVPVASVVGGGVVLAGLGGLLRQRLRRR